MSYLLGYDIGSSSVKTSLLEAETGVIVAAAVSPRTEMEISSPHPGWAEQHPDTWWEHVRRATAIIKVQAGAKLPEVKAIGISYQMHGLVIVDRDLRVLRPAIIWCDSRAVEIGRRAFQELGPEFCLNRLLNSPGNFTASKLKWVKENEPEIYGRIYKAMLPGEYIAAVMTGAVRTTPSGLSEGIWWDFANDWIADFLLDYYGISPELLPEVAPVFAEQGGLTVQAAAELGLQPGTAVAYLAGDQLNNAFSLHVLREGEIAATAGTSGVVYAVSGRPVHDSLSRVNTFVHVNHSAAEPRYGTLLCVNGAAILNRWLRDCLTDAASYREMDELATSAPPGSDGLLILPFGNGAERTLDNRDLGASIHGLRFNLHERAHILRAAQEGIIFALNYGMEIISAMGIGATAVKAGHANMFLSPLFAEAFATVTGVPVELYNTDGAQGAARGAGVGAGIYRDFDEVFVGLKTIRFIEPNVGLNQVYQDTYQRWRMELQKQMAASANLSGGLSIN